jgi:hypothetical protein
MVLVEVGHGKAGILVPVTSGPYPGSQRKEERVSLAGPRRSSYTDHKRASTKSLRGGVES